MKLYCWRLTANQDSSHNGSLPVCRRAVTRSDPSERATLDWGFQDGLTFRDFASRINCHSRGMYTFHYLKPHNPDTIDAYMAL
ncbi:hypothetical protein HanPSC8_Chr11g0483861 [Helianthus annuus]|nr:hypothetical protein HanPSC8_Chr11g0483861 [Helianthus annuus]